MLAVIGVSLTALFGAAFVTAGAPAEGGASEGGAPATRPVRAEQTPPRPADPEPERDPAPASDASLRDGPILDASENFTALAAAGVGTGGPRGTLVAAQAVTPAPAGVGAVWRVLYRSESLDGRPSVVSGAVYVPTGAAPAGGWPLITWGRGTSGTADRCAPSRWVGTDLVPITLAQQGFVVAATDYEGLGTPGLHPYLVGGSEGRSMLDIVPVAGELPGVATRADYAVWGHSQGGHAALFARELAASWLPQRRLAATVAIAPPSFIPQAVEAWATRVRAKGLGLMALAGIAAAYPEASLDQLIDPGFLPDLRAVLEAGCTDDVSRRFADVDGARLVLADPVTTQPWATLLHAQEPAQRPGTGPVLLVHGAIDGTLPPEMSAAIETQMCGRGEPVNRWVLPGAGHGEAISMAWDAIGRWTRDRLTGAPLAGTSCADPFDLAPAP